MNSYYKLVWLTLSLLATFSTMSFFSFFRVWALWKDWRRGRGEGRDRGREEGGKEDGWGREGGREGRRESEPPFYCNSTWQDLELCFCVNRTSERAPLYHTLFLSLEMGRDSCSRSPCNQKSWQDWTHLIALAGISSSTYLQRNYSGSQWLRFGHQFIHVSTT